MRRGRTGQARGGIIGYDVAIIGLGGMGGAAAHHLARRGRRVVGFDRFDPPHDRGSSHGRSRVIRMAYFESPAYLPLLRRAYELWRELERATGRDLLHVTGGLNIGPERSEIVSGALRSCQEHDLPHEVLDAGEVAERFPAFTLAPDEVAVYEQIAGGLVVEDCVAANLDQAAGHGAELRRRTRVDRWTRTPDGGIEVHTDGGTVTADRLIVAAGAWTQDLLGDHLPTQVERMVQTWWRSSTAPEVHAADRMPAFILHRSDEVAAYGLPGLRGEGVKVAFHHGGEVGHPDELSREVTDHDVNRVRELLAGRFPQLDEFEDASVCWYTNSPDRHFVIGPLPAAPEVIVAAGFSGHGFKFCSVVGEVLADLAVDGSSTLDIAPFGPGRLSGVAT